MVKKMEKIRLSRIMTNGKSIFLAYDEGLEHGPVDFNLTNIDPEYIIKLASKAKINGIILEHGIAEKYFNPREHTVPLIIKLNGKTKLFQGEPNSELLCSIDRAVRLGAEAVGFTIYPGSKHEPRLFRTFCEIVDSAHKIGLPVIAWIYPRGKGIDEKSTETIAYSARIALELGADMAKIHYNNDFEGFKWAVKSAGKTKIVMVGGNKTDDMTYLKTLHEVILAVAAGTAT
jgi:class I fructose-bisphosphate aldolase